jgi:hypothetical protein
MLSKFKKGEGIMIQRKGGNIRRLLFLALIMIGLFILASCAAIQQQPAYHSMVMKGSIIHTTDTGVYLCIGRNDGASVGQELNVHRITLTGEPKAPSFKREKIGKVKITEIIDEHFATATIISGKAEKNDIVELAN